MLDNYYYEIAAKFHNVSMPLEHFSRQHETVVSQKLRRGVFPGSFNPLTVAHLEIARRARDDYQLDEVHLTVSEVALDKPTPPGPSLPDRIALIERDLVETPWLSVRTTSAMLIADIAMDYDAVIMGADKWQQVNDASYYGSDQDRDEAVARLPEVIVADRTNYDTPHEHRLKTSEAIHDVSSTKAREGDRSMMAPEAAVHWHDGDD